MSNTMRTPVKKNLGGRGAGLVLLAMVALGVAPSPAERNYHATSRFPTATARASAS
jgi:hypothetical protein